MKEERLRFELEREEHLDSRMHCTQDREAKRLQIEENHVALEADKAAL